MNLKNDAGSWVPFQTYRIWILVGGVQTAVLMISQVILMYIRVWEALLFTLAIQCGPWTRHHRITWELGSLSHNLQITWDLQITWVIWFLWLLWSHKVILMTLMELSMRRAGQDYPVFLSTLMTNIFLLPLWIPLLYPHLNVNIREGNGNPFQYSCPENPMDRRAWWATV